MITYKYKDTTFEFNEPKRVNLDGFFNDVQKGQIFTAQLNLTTDLVVKTQTVEWGQVLEAKVGKAAVVAGMLLTAVGLGNDEQGND